MIGTWTTSEDNVWVSDFDVTMTLMATRSGSIDPGIVLHVQTHHGLSADQVESTFNRESGLLGVSGRILVIATREVVTMLREVRRVLGDD